MIEIDQFLSTPHSRLRFLREALQFSQSNFSKTLGLSRTQYNRCENGKASIPYRKLNALVTYGINPAFIYGTGDMLLNNTSIIEVKEKILLSITHTRGM